MDQPEALNKVGESIRLSEDIEKLIVLEMDRRLDRIVHEAVAREEEKRFRQIKWIAVFIGVVGIGTFGTLGSYFIKEAVDARAGNIKETLELARINNLALKLSITKGFTPDESEEIIDLLRRVSKIDQVRTSQDVRSNLGSILNAFASAGEEAQIDEIFELFRREILKSGLGVEILLHHYGQKIAGRLTIPSASEDLPLKTFEQLEGVAAGHNLEELALCYRLLYEYSTEKHHPNDKLTKLLARSLDLNQRDARRFLREIFIRSIAENWQSQPTPEGRSIERLTRSFLKDYAAVLGKQYSTKEEIFTKWGKEGLSDSEANDAATSLIRNLK